MTLAEYEFTMDNLLEGSIGLYKCSEYGKEAFPKYTFGDPYSYWMIVLGDYSNEGIKLRILLRDYVIIEYALDRIKEISLTDLIDIKILSFKSLEKDHSRIHRLYSDGNYEYIQNGTWI